MQNDNTNHVPARDKVVLQIADILTRTIVERFSENPHDVKPTLDAASKITESLIFPGEGEEGSNKPVWFVSSVLGSLLYTYAQVFSPKLVETINSNSQNNVELSLPITRNEAAHALIRTVVDQAIGMFDAHLTHNLDHKLDTMSGLIGDNADSLPPKL